MENIIVRPLTELSEFLQAVQVQKIAWHRSDYSLIPPTMFKSFVKNGGCVIGALEKLADGSETVVGYAIGYLATNEKRELYHHSQQVAVLADYRQLGLAFQLKQAQKDYVQKHHGLQLMTWTVDPLLSKNAFLNYHKLGAIGRIYWENYYGSREDDLNSGLETDRIEVEWWFSDSEIKQISSCKAGIPSIFPIFDYSDAGIYNEITVDGAKNNYIGVAIPRDLVVLKEQNLQLAVTLRSNFRVLITNLLKNGFVIIDIRAQMNSKSILILTNQLWNLKKIKNFD